jgi:hypothetical protein
MQGLLQLFRVPSKISGRQYNPAEPIVIMQIPKTSGTSFVHGLRTAILPDRPFVGYDAALFGRFDEFETMSGEIREIIYLDNFELPDSDFMFGHIAFSTLFRRYDTANFLTILREPTSRSLSHWLFYRACTDEDLTPWGKFAENMKKGRDPLFASRRAKKLRR